MLINLQPLYNLDWSVRTLHTGSPKLFNSKCHNTSLQLCLQFSAVYVLVLKCPTMIQLLHHILRYDLTMHLDYNNRYPLFVELWKSAELLTPYTVVYTVALILAVSADYWFMYKMLHNWTVMLSLSLKKIKLHIFEPSWTEISWVSRKVIHNFYFLFAPKMKTFLYYLFVYLNLSYWDFIGHAL